MSENHRDERRRFWSDFMDASIIKWMTLMTFSRKETERVVLSPIVEFREQYGSGGSMCEMDCG